MRFSKERLGKKWENKFWEDFFKSARFLLISYHSSIKDSGVWERAGVFKIAKTMADGKTILGCGSQIFF